MIQFVSSNGDIKKIMEPKVFIAYSWSDQTHQELVKHWTDQFHLVWSHYVTIQTIRSIEERKFYEIEAVENSWSVQELQRQINSSLYQHLALIHNKSKLKKQCIEQNTTFHFKQWGEVDKNKMSGLLEGRK